MDEFVEEGVLLVGMGGNRGAVCVVGEGGGGEDEEEEGGEEGGEMHFFFGGSGGGGFVTLLKDGDSWSWVLFSLSDGSTESGPVEFVGMEAR